MVCNDCGAKISEGQKQCPFCGAHNFAENYKEHKETVDGYRRKEYFWKSLPEKLARKGVFLAACVIVGILVLGLLGVGIAHVVGKLKADADYKQVLADADRLEELYQQGDYPAVADAYEKLDDRYDVRLKKYNLVYTLDMYYGFATQDFEGSLQHVRDYQDPLYLHSQQYWFRILQECDSCEKLGYRFDEEDLVAYYRAEADHYLKEELHLSDEDVALWSEKYAEVDSPEKREVFEEEMAQYMVDVYLESLQ